MKTYRKKLTGLYAITDASVTDSQKVILCVEQALRGGARVIQYRDKSSKHDQRLETSFALLELTK